MAEVLLRDLCFRYRSADADTLTGLNLRIASGEAHALLGSSGAGKSTLLNLLAGLLEPGRGELMLGGADMRGLPPAARGVTQVFQFPVLYDAMTVEDNLAFPLVTRRIRRASARRRAREIASQLDIEALLPRRAARLTLTEKQLVAIGKALVREDLALVLLDEPLTAAAPSRKWQLRQTLKSLQRQSGATMIYVTHDQTEALTFAERISVLHEGTILQTGTPEQLLDEPVHEHVGYFVGSPGMNFLDAEVRRGEVTLAGTALTATRAADGPCRAGFRPEWAVFAGGAHAGIEAALGAMVDSTRILGTHRGEPFGLVEGRVGQQRVTTRQPLRDVATGPATLLIRRSTLFRDGGRLDA